MLSGTPEKYVPNPLNYYPTVNPLSANVNVTVTSLVSVVAPRTGKIIKNDIGVAWRKFSTQKGI